MRQFRPLGEEAVSTAETPVRENPLDLLRDAIAQLKSSNGDLPDQAQVANLLAEAREALEHAKVIGGAAAQCEGFLKEGRFEPAFAALDEGLLAYPDDPALVARRREVEERQKAFLAAAAVRGALDEAKWLLDQNRTDLAAHFLREKAAELPDQQELRSRLEELEALLPDWEQKRHVQAALARAATLEQMQQWQAAVTILEEALQAYPENRELRSAAKRIRSRLVEHERQNKLARRLELIRRQIAEQSWRQALTLLDSTQIEFPGARDLKPLRSEIAAGLRRAECDGIVADVRQCLADNDLEQAERVLGRGLEALGPEPELEELRAELEGEKKYREELRTAQVLFGRRQMQEAERVLTQLAAHDRPEARALLDAVRAARAATEEENFCERGREKALALMQQQQFAQAADLLRNLLSLFPGNPILERDLATAQSGLERAASGVATVTEAADEEPRREVEAPVGSADAAVPRKGAPQGFRRAAIAGAASLVLVSAAGGAWKLSHRAAPVSRPAAASPDAGRPAGRPVPVTQAPAAVAAPPAQAPAPEPFAATQAASSQVKTQSATQPIPSHGTPLREFVPPAAKQAPGPIQSAALPLPPGTEPIISAQTIPGLPADLTRPVPPPAAPPQPAVATPAPAPQPVLPAGGRFEAAQLITRKLPAYPSVARQLGLYGAVRMEAVIDERGAVKSVKVLSGEAILATEAKNAVVTWKYKPATLNGKPIASNAEIEIVFGDRNK